MPSSASTPSLRKRKRLAAMQRVQQQAVRLFLERGFDAVTVEQVAEVAEVSPVSVYRWFGAKEGLVLWDDYDPGLLAGVAERLPDMGPLDAVRGAVIAELARIYDADHGLVLARTRLLYREPALLAAAARNARAMQAALAAEFARAGRGDSDFARDVLAAAAVSVLTAAVDAWQRDNGRTPLARFVDDGFAALRRA